MNDSLYIAATGMHAQQKGVDTIANNLANVNTPGFKKSRITFEDLVHRSLNGAAPVAGEAGEPQLWQGSGVGIAALLKTFAGGDLKKTERPMDLAIQGEGFLEVTAEDGTPAYTRGGTLTVDKDGMLTTLGGQVLKPGVQVGLDAKEIRILPDGRVMVRTRDDGSEFEAGRIDMVRFADSSALAGLGMNLYRATERSGEPILGRAGEDGMGTLAQGFIEGSNVSMVDEMVDLMVAQRAYEASVKVIQASDEMLAMSNNLRK